MLAGLLTNISQNREAFVLALLALLIRVCTKSPFPHLLIRLGVGGGSRRRHSRAHSYPPILIASSDRGPAPPAPPPAGGVLHHASCSLPQGLRFTPTAAFSITEPQRQPALSPRPFLETPHQKFSSGEFSGATFTVKDTVSDPGWGTINKIPQATWRGKIQKQRNTFLLGALLQAGATGVLGETLGATDPCHWQERPWRSPRCYTQGTPDQHCWTPPENQQKAGGLQMWYWMVIHIIFTHILTGPIRLTRFKSLGKKKNSSLQVSAATAAKSLQSCPTLCDPLDSSPPGSPVPGTLQARTLEWVAISFSYA